MKPEETYEFEDRVYVNPTQSRDEQLAFIDAFRQTQNQANQQIQQDTHNLGTQVPSSLGGLTSGTDNENSYWRSRYQTPQVDAQVAALQTVTQSSALKNILANEQAQLQNQYNQAYRDYAKRQAAASNSSSTTTTTTNGGTTDGSVDEESTSGAINLGNNSIQMNVGGSSNPTSRVPIMGSDGTIYGYTVTDLVTGEVAYYDVNGNKTNGMPTIPTSPLPYDSSFDDAVANSWMHDE